MGLDTDRVATRERATDRRPTRVPYFAAVAWYAVFIARTSFVANGRRTFGLLDDAMISLTYARNLAQGNGLVWYPGAPKVEGITNLGWTLVLTIPHLLHVPERFTALVIELIGVGVLVGCGALAGRIAVHIVPGRRVRTMATAFTLFCYPLVHWTLRGLEVGVITLLLLVATSACIEADDATARRTAWRVGLAAGAGVVVRLDFAVFLPVLLLWVAWRRRGAARAMVMRGAVLGVSLGIVGQELFRRWYYGAWVPNTYALKVGGVSLWVRAHRGLGVVSYAVITGVAVVAVVAWWAWRSARTDRSVIALVLGLALSAVAYCIYVGGDAWDWYGFADRYLTPALVLLLVVAAAGIESWTAELVPRKVIEASVAIVAVTGVLVAAHITPHGRAVFGDDHIAAVVVTAFAIAPVLFVAVVLRQLWSRATVRASFPPGVVLAVVVAFAVSGPAALSWARFGAAEASTEARRVRLGETLRAVTHPDARIAVTAAGSVIYFSHRPGIDILGKMDPRIAHEPMHRNWYFFPGHMKWDYAVTLSERPDVIAELFFPDARERAMIRDAGFALWRLRPEVVARLGLDARPGHDAITFLVRRDSTAVDFSQLEPVPTSG